jgi:hypothetical protein
MEAFAIVVWSLAFVLFLVALALLCPLCRRDVKDGSTCCNKCVASLLGLVFVSHLVTSDEGTLHLHDVSFGYVMTRGIMIIFLAVGFLYPFTPSSSCCCLPRTRHLFELHSLSPNSSLGHSKQGFPKGLGMRDLRCEIEPLELVLQFFNSRSTCGAQDSSIRVCYS